MCRPAESGPNPGPGATVAHADGGGKAPPYMTCHYSWLAFIPKQGVTCGAAPSPTCVPRRGGRRLGCGEAWQGRQAAALECSGHIFLS